MRFASDKLRPAGKEHTTCLPIRKALLAICECVGGGESIMTKSTSDLIKGSFFIAEK